MPLIKDIQEKNFVALKDYVGERVASIVAGKIQAKKEGFLSKIRGMVEMEKPEADKDEKKEKKEDKDKKPEHEEPDGDEEGEDEDDDGDGKDEK